tara:strand:- start:3046 stop:4470 length:1425 start_codon:yes stop_codon:yes gene_type:complete
MAGSLNLDPDSYSVPEMCKLLGVSPGAPRSEVEEARDTLARQLRAAGDIDLGNQGTIGLFLDTITSKIINVGSDSRKGTEGRWSQPYTPITEQGSNIIITNPDTIAGRQAKVTGGREANSGAAPPGYLNPINVRTLQQAVNIDSRFRPQYFATPSTDFAMDLPEVQKKVVSLRVGSMELPLTFYAISESQGNAHMLIVGESIPGSGPPDAWLVRVPDGNYEQSWARQSRAAHIERAMNDALNGALRCTVDLDNGFTSPGGGTNVPNLVFQVDRASGRSMFVRPGTKLSQSADVTRILFNIDVKEVSSASAPGSRFMQASIDTATNLQLRLGWQLGFRSAEYSITDGASPPPGWLGGEGIASESPCHISGPRYGLLSIDDHQRNASTSFTVAFGESSLDSNIISRINLAPSLSGDGVFQSIDAPGLTTTLNRTREYFGPVDIQRLHVRLLDEYGRVIDLNGCDWSFSLAFEKLYD